MNLTSIDCKRSNIAKRALMALLVLLIWTNAHGQLNQLDTLIKKFESYRMNNLHEKIYVHTDRTFYLTGETLWFKIYYGDGSFHKPLDISKVCYLEILDHENHAVMQTKVGLTGGSGYGSLYLTPSISSGNYIIRAYTQWMKNFGADAFFHKSITIVNTFKTPESLASADIQHYDAQFFPEGGNLVAGIKSKVAFRVTNTKGQGIDFNGVVLDQHNNTVVSFQPLKFGIGNFSFTPSANHIYTAVIKDENGNLSNFKLPVIHEQGYVMAVRDSTANQLSITVTARQNLTTSNPVVYLFTHTRQMNTLAEMRILQNGKTSFLINKKDLKEGVSHLTLFDAALNPVAERLYFRLPEKRLTINIQPDQHEYGSRRQVKINLLTESNTHQTQPSNLSVAVIRMDSLSGDDQDNILNYLLLTSELKGTIESPEYYFNNQDTLAVQATDNLMLTHGWRRFSWDKVLSREKPLFSFIPECQGHFIHGKVIDESGKPAAGITTYLAVPANNIQLYGSRTNTLGEVQYETKYFWGQKRIVAQLNTEKDSTYHIQITSPFLDQFISYSLPEFKLYPRQEKQLLARSIGMQTQDVFYDGRTYQTARLFDSTAFFGKADETYYLDDYTRFPIMEEVMREYISGVLVRKRKNSYYFIVLDRPNKTIFKDNSMVLLDGVPIFNTDKIMAFDPLKIKKIEVLTRKYYLGPLTFQGMVSYRTYQGDLAGFTLDPKSVSLDYEGLQLQQEFYSPQYENQRQRDSRLPDQRSLLYWAPNILTNKDGKRQVEFYTSDLTGIYTIVVEGITQDGLPGHSSTSFKVIH